MCTRFLLTLLLLAQTDSLSSSTSRLGVLTTHSQLEVVADTTVGSDLLQALQVVTQLRVEVVREDLERLSVDDVYGGMTGGEEVST